MRLPELRKDAPIGLLLEQTLHPTDRKIHLRGRVLNGQAVSLDEAHGPSATGVARRTRSVRVLLAPIADRRANRTLREHFAKHRKPPSGGKSGPRARRT